MSHPSHASRSACATGSVCVSVQDTCAVLHVGSSPGDLSVDLTRLEETDAKDELRKLLFRMGDSLTQLNSTGKSLYRMILDHLILNEIAGPLANMFCVRVCTVPF